MTGMGEWAERQLDQAGYPASGDSQRHFIRSSVLTLVRIYDNMLFEEKAPESGQTVIDLLHELLNRRALPVKNDMRRWYTVRQYPPSLGSRVKIRPDAFTGTQGMELNGREGVLQGARRGDYIVGFDDGAAPTSTRVQGMYLLTQAP